MTTIKWAAVMAAGLMLGAVAGRANNLKVTNVVVEARDASTAYVKFDIMWENSWRYTNINHDAAWVFFKVQQEGGLTWTDHVILEANQVTNPTGFSVGSGTPLDFIVPTDKVGMFVRRAAEGSGTLAATNVTAVWNFATNGLTKNSKVKIQAFAVEMVFVAQGNFKLGDGAYDRGQFFEGGGASNAFQIVSEAEIATSNLVGCLWGASQSGITSMGGNGVIPNAFPKGYAAFYCMKYEITEGQWVDFFNTLTDAQKATRDITSSLLGGKNSDGVVNRNTVAWTTGDATSAARDRACSYLAWADVCAFAAWAGLRPMTELEFEKACRGPLNPVANEYAWGDTVITPTTAMANDGTGMDTATGGNCNYDACAPDGPYRAGIYAKGSSSRQAAGASYWGIMELSGNQWERAVTVGSATGRLFAGLHGNGTLDAFGNANVTTWPGTSASGAGSRGGNWYGSAGGSSSHARASDRGGAANTETQRFRQYSGLDGSYGGRAVRSAPSEVEP